MKELWNNFVTAFSMFSKIPMPMADWNKENMKYMLCFFPWVGAVIGVFSAAANLLLERFGFSVNFSAAVLLLIPMLVTGGIHVDGLLDTADALSSWRDRERRLEILKDSHAGAFAVIIGCIYFVTWFGFFSEICFHKKAIWILGAGYMVSRALSGIGVVTFPKAKKEGTVSDFSRLSENVRVRGILIVYLFFLLGFMIWIDLAAGIITFASAAAVLIWYYHMAMKYFGGTTGDLSGCFLCACEWVMTLVLALLCSVTGL